MPNDDPQAFHATFADVLQEELNNKPKEFSETFSHVLPAELRLIRIRRAGILLQHLAATKAQSAATEDHEQEIVKNLQQKQSAATEDQTAAHDDLKSLAAARRDAQKEHLAGIAFSGGGIRSGTFAVGVLQGLSSLGLLRRFDYLSTVSGGGYAGGWLAAWLQRDGDVENVERQLASSRVKQADARREILNPTGDTRAQGKKPPVVDEEPEPIHHLRSYSSYMAPRMGLLTADTWTIIMIWVRNVFVNLMMFFPLAMVLALSVRLLVYGYAHFYDTAQVEAARTPIRPLYWYVILTAVLGLVLLLVGLGYNGLALRGFRGRDLKWIAKTGSGIYYWMVYPLLGAALCLSLGLRPIVGWIMQSKDHPLLDLPNIYVHALVLGGVMMIGAIVVNGKRFRWKFLGCGLLAGASGGVLLVVVGSLLNQFIRDNKQPELAALLGVPTLLLVLITMLMVEVALLGRTISEAEREWRSRFGALLLISALLWLIVFATVLYLPAAFLLIGVIGRVVAASGWLTTTAVGVIAGRIALPRAGGGKSALGLVAAVAPPVFLAGLLGASALLAAYLINTGYELRLMSWGDGSGVPTSGNHLVIVGTDNNGLLHIRIFHASGDRVTDTDETKLPSTQAAAISTLKQQLPPLLPPHVLTGAENSQVLTEVTSILSQTHFTKSGQEAQSVWNYWEGVRHSGFEQYWERVKNSNNYVFQGKLLLVATRGKLIRPPALLRSLLWLLGFALMARIGSRLIDVNLFSLNAMYANRLIRCYLGASRRKSQWSERWSTVHGHIQSNFTVLSGAPIRTESAERRENPVTGFDPKDDFDLLKLRIGAQNEEGRPYLGPMLLVNTTLNLVGGKELAWRDRKGESFVLSPLYCGAKGTGFARTDDTGATDDMDGNLTLGRAMSISGAAVDPNMRYYQSPSLTAFLTVLNARLGYWLENPNPKGGKKHRLPGQNWTAASPRYGTLLWDEFFGRTDGRGAFVHLSDGGHFDNLGVYELIRRRCRYIVACDAGEDSGPSDDNLATLIRLVRIDFGVRIELDTTPLREEGPHGLTRTHVVIGRVHYEDVDNGQMPGMLIYLKISLTGDEPPDLQQYAQARPDFPHQPTDLRQSFDEAQFEAYRVLGSHIARTVFKDAAHAVELWTETDDTREEFVRNNRRLFAAVQGRWSEPPLDQDAHHIESTRAWIEFQRDLRTDPKLAGLSHDLYPELRPLTVGQNPSPPTAGPEMVRAELHAVGQMLQIMEDAWVELGLKGHADLPMNRGWLNMFRRWAGTKAFQRFWPVHRSEFSPEFVRFCENELHLAEGGRTWRLKSKVEPPAFRNESVKLIAEEFAREWPEEMEIDQRIARAKKFDLIEDKPVWLIFQAPSGTSAASLKENGFVSGIVLLMREENEDGRVIPGAYELFAWVRRPHRSVRLGTQCIGEIIDVVCDGLKKQLTGPDDQINLKVRYPKSGHEGDDDMERIRWLNFFALYDFKPVRPDAKGSVSVRTIPQ